VHDLGVEHQAVAFSPFVGSNGERRALGAGDDLEPWRERLDPVAVAHPHLVLVADVPQAVEQARRGDDIDERAAKFLLVGRDDLAAQLLGRGLLAVADGEDQKPASKCWGARGLSPPSPTTGRRKDDPWASALIGLFGAVERRVSLGPSLAHPSRDPASPGCRNRR
jgi:hypothetical protein